MEQMFNAAAQFPTVIFSTLLGIVVIYWIVGALGIVDLGLSSDAEIEIDADVDADVSAGGIAGLFLTFGLTGIPFTLIISIIILICWLISIYLQFYILSWLGEGWLLYLAGVVVSAVIFFISLPITAVIIRPLKGMFKSVEATNSGNLVGKDATVVTGSVSETFGQAKTFHDGAEILLDVRCDQPHEIKMGDKVIVIEYLSDKHAYIVAPM